MKHIFLRFLFFTLWANIHRKHLKKKLKFFVQVLKKVNNKIDKKTSRVWDFFLGLMDPSRKRLVSTAIQNRKKHMHQNNIFFFKSVQIYMKDAKCADSKVMVIFVTSSPQFSMNFHNNSKNKNRKEMLFSFSHILVWDHRVKKRGTRERAL